MAEMINMPKLGMDMEEGTLLRWLKKAGEAVKKGEPIAEIETDKSAMEIEAPNDGVLLCTYCKEEDTVPINTPIAAIGAAGEQPPAVGSGQPAAPAAAPAAAAPAAAQLGGVDPAHLEGAMTMPKLGMDMEEGTLLRWVKKVGDTLKKGDVLAEIETDKSSMELEATTDGTLLKTYCEEGETVPVGQPIAFIGAQDAAVPEFGSTQQPAAPTPAPAASAAPAEPVMTERTALEAPAAPDGRKLRVSPRARKLAEKNGVDLRAVAGSGPAGRIVEKDVRAFLQSGAPHAARRSAAKHSETVKPLAGIRKVISTRMHQSLSEMAQANHRMDADMTNMAALRKQLNASPEFAQSKVSYLDLIALACTRALMDCPFANVSLMPDGIHYKEYVNVGIAVDTERGLVVPVVHDVDQMNLRDFQTESKRLIEKARTGALKPDDMSGGTFTISNLGMFGIDSFTAIINPPEACILAIGRIADKAVVVNGEITIRPIMNLSLTYDHRILDGAPAARFLQKIQFYVENPALLLLS